MRVISYLLPMRKAVAILLSLTGCRILSLPPASSRTDGGPVSSRGVVSHEARSQLRVYRDAAGCESVQTLNRQFRLVTVATAAGPHRLVLEEAYDLRYCLGAGGSSSEATITAWRPDSNSAAAPAFRITTRAISGAPARNLYRFESVGCCGSGTIGTYYSLLTGRMLFASSLRPLELGTVAGEPVRFIAFHDTFSAIAPVEATDSTVIGVFESADDSTPSQRLVLRADRAEPFALEELTFWRARRPIEDSAVPFPGRDRSLAVAVRLQAPQSGRRVRIVVPIAGDSLDRAGATLPAGFSFSQARER